MHILTIGQLSQQSLEIDAVSVLGIAHQIAGWLLIVFAILMIAVAGPRRRSQVFAVLFASAIVLVVVSGCASPAAAAAPNAPGPDHASSAVPIWLGGIGLGFGALAVSIGVVLGAGALRLLGAALELLLAALRATLTGAALVALVLAIVLLAA